VLYYQLAFIGVERLYTCIRGHRCIVLCLTIVSNGKSPINLLNRRLYTSGTRLVGNNPIVSRLPSSPIHSLPWALFRRSSGDILITTSDSTAEAARAFLIA